MKKLFYISCLLLLCFEIANVYFIMPMPGSQEIQSIDLAYFLYSWRWIFRIVFTGMIVFSFWKTVKTPRLVVRIITLIPVIAVCWLFNFVMVADKMFLQPQELIMKNVSENTVPLDRIIIGVVEGDQARAYPIEYLAYHHQVQDSVNGKNILVTYCSVCRSGRVFEPLVKGKKESFRLVGMDHFNAMFEDKTTGSWWRQVNGEAITGELTGEKLPEIFSRQMSLREWLMLYPNSLIMQPDPSSVNYYDPDAKFEKGQSTSSLTGTNSESWKKKSWVLGIELEKESKAYDWNLLKKERIINDQVGDKKIIVVLSEDEKSFAAFENHTDQVATISADTIIICNTRYNLNGSDYSGASENLKKIRAYQEFWHSWLTFHPKTLRY